MITKVQAYQTASGVFQSIEDAQKAELIALQGPRDDGEEQRAATANWVLDHKDAILDILTMTASSKARARKINGGKKTRKPPTMPTPMLERALESMAKSAAK